MERTRRDVLAAGGTALLAALAGCGGGGDGDDEPEPGGTNQGLVTPTPTPDPTPNLTFDGFRLRDEGSSLVVAVTVVNDGDEQGSGTFDVFVRAGEREFSREQSVSLDVGDSRTYEFEFADLTRQEVLDDGAVDVNWQA